MFRLRSFTCAILANVVLLACRPANALVVESGSTGAIPVGVGNDPGWLNVTVGGNLGGSRNYIYLGDGWALTARHVGAPLPGETLPFFNGTSTVQLGMIPNQTFVVRNPASVLNSLGNPVLLNTPNGGLETDLQLIRLNGDPGFVPGTPSVTIAEQPLGVDDDLLIIGHGRTKITPQKHWNSSWQEVPTGSGSIAFNGYSATDPNDDTKRWGKNDVANANDFHSPNAFYDVLTNATALMKLTTPDGITRNVITFASTFNAPGAGVPAEESQAADGDSGSAVFHKRGTQWELAGIINSTLTFSGQPARTAVYGDVTTMTDLSYYYHTNVNQDYAFSISDIIRNHANYSKIGDVNLDGVVSGDGSGPAATDDVSAFIAGWGTNNGTGVGTITTWKLGDLSGPTGLHDGKTDVYDFLALRNSITNPMGMAALEQFYQSASGHPQGSVPEPSSLLLGVLALSLVAARVRPRRPAVH